MLLGKFYPMGRRWDSLVSAARHAPYCRGRCLARHVTHAAQLFSLPLLSMLVAHQCPACSALAVRMHLTPLTSVYLWQVERSIFRCADVEPAYSM